MISHHFCVDTLFFGIQHKLNIVPSFCKATTDRCSQTSTHRHDTEQRNSEKVAVIILMNTIISKLVGKIIGNWRTLKI